MTPSRFSVCCVALFPVKWIVPSLFCIPTSAASPYARVCFCFVALLSCLNNSGSVFDPPSLPSLGSLVSSLPHPAGHRNAVLLFLLLFCTFSGLVVSSFVFRLDVWGRPFVGPSRGQINRTGRSSKQQPCPLRTRPAP